MYYLEVISLEKCPYSLAAEKLLKSKDVNFDLVKVNYSDKETYKTEKISTFLICFFTLDFKFLFINFVP